MDLLPVLLRKAPDLAVVIITAYATIASSVEAMRCRGLRLPAQALHPGPGARYAGALAANAPAAEPDRGLAGAGASGGPGAGPALRRAGHAQALDRAFLAAAGEATVLLRGESGTGKGVLARAMHARSPRAGGAFVALHCPSLSAESLESELFGHAKGAAAGAVQDAAGKTAAADGGTLFLDEIGGLPLAAQSKVLRLVQEKTYERVGDTRVRSADVRIVAASNRDLKLETAAGRFREDLYAQLTEAEVELPPLRRRRADILPLAERLLRSARARRGRPSRSGTRRKRPSPHTTGPATFGSCASSSNGPRSWPPARKSASPTCPRRSAPRRPRGSRPAAP